MHAGSSGPMTPRRMERQRVILPVLGGVCNEENVALGALDMTANPYFKDHAEFQGFLLHNGTHKKKTVMRIFVLPLFSHFPRCTTPFE